MGLLILALTGGCAGPSLRVSPADAALFAPEPVPAGFDRQRALLTLSRIPDAPPVPRSASAGEAIELPRQAMQRLEEARRLFADQRYTETISEVSTALRYNANIHEAHQLMALACQLSGNEEQAKLHALRALELKSDDLACHYVLARLAEKAEKPNEAMRGYRTALRCEPPIERGGEGNKGRSAGVAAQYLALVHYHLGLLLEKKGYAAASIEQLAAFETQLAVLGERVNQNPELATLARVHRGTALLARARSHALLGQYGASADALGLAVHGSPKDWKLRREWVRMLVRAGQRDKASAAASQFVADSRGDSEALDLFLAVYRVMGRPRAAVGALKAIMAQQPDNVDLRLFYVDALLSANQLNEAADALQALAASHPDLAEVHWKLIALNRTRAAWKDWLWALTQELAARPDGASRASQELGQVPEATARAMVDEGVGRKTGGNLPIPVISGNDAVASALDYLLGLLAARLGRTEDRERLLARAAQGRPIFLPAARAVAEIDTENCRWQEAMTLLDAAGKQADRPVAWLEAMRGRCLDGLDRNDEAVKSYQKALQLDRADVRAMTWLARLYERMGKGREATQQYEAILAADPDNLPAREEIVRSLWASREQMPRLVQELDEMKRLDADAPATQRCLALVQFLHPPSPDLQGYAGRLRQLIESHPDDARCREELIVTLITLGDYTSARGESAELVKRRPCSDQANELVFLVLMRMLAFDDAQQQLNRMLAWYPNRESWIQKLAQLRLYELDYDGAIALWNRLLALRANRGGEGVDTREFLYRLRLMQTYRRAKRFAEARELAEAWLAKAPDNEGMVSQLRWFVLAADAGAGDHDRYLARVRGWLDADPKNAQLRGWLLGVNTHYPSGSPGLPPGSAGLIGAKRYDEAVIATIEWLSSQPDESDLIEWLIESLQAGHRNDESIELAAAHASASDESQTRIARLNLLREAYLRAHKYEEAVGAAKDVVSESRKFLVDVEESRQPFVETYLFEQRRLLGQVLVQAKRYDEAVNHLRAMIDEVDDIRRESQEMMPQAKDPRQRLQLWAREQEARKRQTLLLRAVGYVYQRQGSTDLAIERVREAYELLPKDVGLNNDFGYTLADAGRELDEAERMLRLALADSPDEAAYMDSFGWLLYKKGQFAMARTWLRRASAMESGEDPVIFDHLGDIEWRMGLKKEAAESWKRSLEIHDRKQESGEAETEDKVVAKVKAKWDAARQGGKADVAPIPADTQPAP